MRAQTVQMLEHGLAVFELTEGIDYDDEIEWAGQLPDEGLVLDIACQKRKKRVGLACFGDHALADINSYPVRRLQGGEKISGATSKLQHTSSFPDREFQIEEVFGMKERGARKPVAALGRARIRQMADLLLAGRRSEGRGRIDLEHVPLSFRKHVEASSKPSPTGSDGSVGEGVVGKRVLG